MKDSLVLIWPNDNADSVAACVVMLSLAFSSIILLSICMIIFYIDGKNRFFLRYFICNIQDFISEILTVRFHLRFFVKYKRCFDGIVLLTKKEND